MTTAMSTKRINSSKTIMPNTIMAIYTWLRIALSYCVVGAIITTLLSAYLQSVNLLAISIIMSTFLIIGVYKAEKTRKSTGLAHYFAQLSSEKHIDL